MRIKDLPASEFKYFYGAYLKTLDEQEDIMSALLKGRDRFQKIVLELTDEQLRHSYAEGKWSVAEVLVHLIDTERIFQYRAFRISRNDQTPLPGFEQDDYIIASSANQRTKEDIVEEYLSVREASISLFKNMSDSHLKRTGTASGLSWSVAALGLVISGHQKHHVNILNERYLN